MSEQSNSEQSTPSPSNLPQPAPKRRRGALFITGIAVAAALTGAVATTAVSQGFRGGYGPGPGFGHGMGWGHGGMMGAIESTVIENFADRGVRHLAIEIDATSEQQEKLRAIVKSAVKDLLPLREKARTAHQKAHSLLTQQSVDRAAIEQFRAEQIAMADAASKRFTQAITEAAEVLSPEQRQKIDAHLAARRGYWRGWHRG